MTYKFYAGIGARDTPDDILTAMEGLGSFLAKKGYILRSGAADGADTAFEKGCDRAKGEKEIFLPWLRFNDHQSEYWRIGTLAYDIAEKFHPKWKTLKPGAKKMMGRNVYQVEGKTHEEMADFIVCWTKGGKVIGGTGQALRMAAHHKIPVFNLGAKPLDKIEKDILAHLSKTKCVKTV